MYATIISADRIRHGEEVEDRVLRAANGLLALDLVPGDTIALLMRNDFPLLELMLAAEHVGVVAVPMNWHGSVEELHHVLEDCGARVVFAHTDLLNRARPVIPEACRTFYVDPPGEIREAYRLDDAPCLPLPADIEYEAWLQALHPSPVARVAPPYRLLYSSGTTGKAKGVKRRAASKEVAEQMGVLARRAHGLELRPIRALMPGPLYHSAPGVYALNCLRHGEVLVLQPRFDAEHALDLIARHRLSHAHMVPTMFARMLALPDAVRKRYDVTTLKAVVHGAALCPPDIKRAMIDWWGPVILEYYAATELGIVTHSTSQEWLKYPGTVGRPPEGVELRVADDDGNPVAAGTPGEIFIRSAAAALLAYHNRPDAMEEVFRDGWVTLGDVGYVNEAGFLWLCDRKKDLVISGGVNIFPAELEDVVQSLPGVKDCVAFGIPDRDLGEVLALVVEPEAGAVVDTAALTEAVRERLGRLRTPKVVVPVSWLPREDSGKLARRKIKQQFLEGGMTA